MEMSQDLLPILTIVAFRRGIGNDALWFRCIERDRKLVVRLTQMDANTHKHKYTYTHSRKH